jgi:hypothetical protein
VTRVRGRNGNLGAFGDVRGPLRIAGPVLAVFVLWLTACGADRPRTDGPRREAVKSGAAEREPIVLQRRPGPLYEVSAMVLEDETHGPMLCLVAVLTSLPPQCGDVRIAGWDWRAVAGAETARGTTWGMYDVVGRYDGKVFVVTEVGPYEANPSAVGTDVDFATPCREPAGGWTGLDEATQDDARAALAYARSQPGYVTSWVTHLDAAKLEFGPVIVNAVFTANRMRHQMAIRNVWGGPLCVVERDVRTARELRRIRREAEATLDGLGVQILWSSGPGTEPIVEICVVVDSGTRAQAALNERYGLGVVRLLPVLTPAS